MSREELIEWESRYVERGAVALEPAAFIVTAVDRLGDGGTAVDLAGGTGRHAIWLAGRGWQSTLVDISPTALEIGVSLAKAAGIPLRTWLGDLDDALPLGGPFDLAVIHHYLNRRLLERIPDLLSLGGHLVMAHPTVTNLERNDRPGPAYLLEPGELPSLLVGMEIESHFEGWTSDGRHEAQVVARRPV